ncbi:hypothetical protein GF386_03710 [Candidatus Pacearchaeota archaeon]|nr:hypothetical protein [Candidatus Pacearchaeota archaeon]MBD3283258.1 hypothetical protein [Candidatus Pacearchaeota archaeon]
MALYNFNRINGKLKRVWNPGRNRGLELAKERVGDLSKDVKKLLDRKKSGF